MWGICFVAAVTETQQHVGNLDLLATAEFLQLSRQAKSKDAMWAVRVVGGKRGRGVVQPGRLTPLAPWDSARQRRIRIISQNL